MNHRLLKVAVVAGLIATHSAFGADVDITPDVVYGHKSGLAMTFDVFTPKDEAKNVGLLFMVSGGWYSAWVPPEQAAGLFRPYTDRGFTVFAVRHGSSPKFTIAEAVDDVRRSVRFIRLNAERFSVDPDRLGVFGFSAGGHLSLMLGTSADDGDPKKSDPVLQTSDRVQAVVAWVAPTDLRGVAWSDPDHHRQYENFPALDINQETATELSPLLHVTENDAPTLLIVGDQDKLVPPNHSQEIDTAFQSAGVSSRLVTIEGAGHGFMGRDLQRAVSETADWFERQLNQRD